MGVNLRTELLNASRVHFEAHIEKHRVNVENLLQNSVGIGEHSDVTEAVIAELDKMSAAYDRIEMIEKYFSKND